MHFRCFEMNYLVEVLHLYKVPGAEMDTERLEHQRRTPPKKVYAAFLYSRLRSSWCLAWSSLDGSWLRKTHGRSEHLREVPKLFFDSKWEAAAPDPAGAPRQEL